MSSSLSSSQSEKMGEIYKRPPYRLTANAGKKQKASSSNEEIPQLKASSSNDEMPPLTYMDF